MSPASRRPKFVTALFHLRQSDYSHLTEDSESTIIDRRDEATNLTVPTVTGQLLTPPSELMRGRDVVQPQMANSFLHGVNRLRCLVQRADVLAEHLLKGSEVWRAAMIVAFAIILYYTYDVCTHILRVRDVPIV